MTAADSLPTQMTKKIWIFWAQGWDNAPDLVVKCKKSWEQLNPDYEIIAFDGDSIGEYIDVPTEIGVDRPDIPVVKISDLIRAGLLAKHGGVWVDATLMCTTPLKDWLPEYYSTGFFAFRNPGRDRLISSWFLAAEPGNKLMERIYDEYSSFLSQNIFSNQNNTLGLIFRAIYRKKWNRKVSTSVNWHSSTALNILKTYPYYIFHYTVNKIILEEDDCASILYRAKPFEAEPCHKLQIFSRQKNGLAKAHEFLEKTPPPLHKLNRRRDIEVPYWRSVLDAIAPSGNG